MTPERERAGLRELHRRAREDDDAFGLILVGVVAVMGLVLFVCALVFVALIVWMVLRAS